MDFSTFIFDLDGTLVHTRSEYMHDVIKKTLKDFGKDAKDSQIKRIWFGPYRDEFIMKHFGILPDLFWRSFRNHDTVGYRKNFVRTYNDIAIVKHLKALGCRTAIVTGSPHDLAFMELDLIGRNHFDHVVIARDEHGIRFKPDPHGIEECLRLCNVEKNDAVYIGNGAEDIISAQSAGVFDILVKRDEHKIDDVNPSLVISSLCELKKFAR